MPQFVLNTPPTSSEINMARLNGGKPRKVHPFYSLDTFARGYVEAMFFTNGDTGDARENLLNDWGVECLTADAVETIRKDCARFLAFPMGSKGKTVQHYITVLQDLGTAPYGNGCCDDQRAGNLFWFARQGHGVAWTDNYRSGTASNAIADKLQDACGEFSECYVEAYRKKIHVR